MTRKIIKKMLNSLKEPLTETNFSNVFCESVLGPLLFSLYINDITDLFRDNISIKLFADDIKIYMEIENNSDTVIFQEYINIVSDWANKWQLKFCLLYTSPSPRDS